ncbi:MAG: serine/threonine-protein kinase [Nakamurella sp.]
MPAEFAVTAVDPADYLPARDLTGIGALATARTIGGYQLGQLIGRGGSSVVYRAFDGRSRVVAIKLAISERCGDPAFRRQFSQQTRVSAVLDHRSVLPVIDSGEHRGRPYLVMPHVQGADLRQRLVADRLTVGRILVLLRQVADGLDALHASGVLHLDVKPANVLVGRVDGAVTSRRSPERTEPIATDASDTDASDTDASDTEPAATRAGQQERAYLADLGLCRFLKDKPSKSAPDFVGSPRFSSPEHLCGRALQSAADVYALTCLLFASLAGQPPYVGGLPAIVTGHLSGRVPSLAALTGLPRSLDRVVRRGMHPDPGSRYGSCRELVEGARLAILG